MWLTSDGSFVQDMTSVKKSFRSYLENPGGSGYQKGRYWERDPQPYSHVPDVLRAIIQDPHRTCHIAAVATGIDLLWPAGILADSKPRTDNTLNPSGKP